MADEPVLPEELAATVMRVDELVQHFEEYPDPLVRGPAIELLQLIDGLHRGGLRRLADLLRAAGLQRRALDDPEARLLYDLYDLDQPDADVTGGPAAPLRQAAASPDRPSASGVPSFASPVPTFASPGLPAASLASPAASVAPPAASPGPPSASPGPTAAPRAPVGSFVPLARLFSKDQPRG